jgi:hypothetical protein
VIDQVAIVIDHIAGGAQVIRQMEVGLAQRVLVGQQHVDRIGPERAADHVAIGLQGQHGAVAIIDEKLRLGRAGACAVRIDRFGNQPVKRVVGVVNLLGSAAAKSGALGDLDQPVAMVPFILCDRRITCAERAVAIILVP